MRVEASRKIIPQEIFSGARKFTFPLYTHKRESDNAGKHREWSPQQHIVLTTLAILTDVGFNSAVAMLVFSGNLWVAASVKYIHIKGAEKAPQIITNLKNYLKKQDHQPQLRS